jgi:hypothetical protein
VLFLGYAYIISFQQASHCLPTHLSTTTKPHTHLESCLHLDRSSSSTKHRGITRLSSAKWSIDTTTSLQFPV